MKTHYRKAFDSPYLSSADIVDPVILTIARVTLEADHTHKTKDVFNTAHFAEKALRPGEPLKPMILNATNCKFLATLTGSKWIDDWSGVQVTVYVEPHVKFGRETVEGLRLAKAVERVEVPQELLDAAKDAAAKGLAAYAEFFKNTGPDNRVLLGSHHKALKTLAESVKVAEIAE